MLRSIWALITSNAPATLSPNSLQRRFGILIGAKQRAPFNLGTKGESRRAGRRYVRPRRSQLYQSVPAPGASQTHGRRRVDGSRSGLGVASVRGPLCAFCAPGPARRDERFAIRFHCFRTAFAAVTAPPAPGPRALPRPRSGARVPYAATHAGRLGRRLGNGNHLNIYNPRYNRMSAHPVASQILHRHRRAPATYDIVRRRNRPCTFKVVPTAHTKGAPFIVLYGQLVQIKLTLSGVAFAPRPHVLYTRKTCCPMPVLRHAATRARLSSS